MIWIVRELNVRELKLCIHLKISGIDASLGSFETSRTPSTVFSECEVSRKITSSLAGSLLSGLFQELIVAAVRLAAALWPLSCGQMMAAR